MIRNQTLILILLMTAAITADPRDTSAQQDPRVHAIELLKSTPLIDGHNDLPWTIRMHPWHPRSVEKFNISERQTGDTDIPRMRKGRVAAQFWSVYVPGETTEGFAKVQLEQLDIVRRMIDAHDELQLALTADDIENAFAEGKIASLIGLEGGHVIENSLGALRAYYLLGARYMTLTHNVTLDWVDSAMDDPTHGGLTDFGGEVIREMNRLGMLADLSHVSPDVMMDVLDTSESPVIFSHSSARALTDHRRNVPDSVLARMRDNGGVVMVTFIPAFVSQAVSDWDKPFFASLKGIESAEAYNEVRAKYAKDNPPPKATISDVADHIDYVREVAGVAHVGIGSDFWQSGDMPDGLEDVSKFPDLFAELIRRGWSDDDLKLLAGQNTLRVLRQAAAVAERLQTERDPSTVVFK
ncbi:MAG: dipeptidase [Rhodothermia bacterium]